MMAMYFVGPAELAISSGQTKLSVQLIGAIYTFDSNYPRPMDCAGKIIMKNLQSAVQARISPNDYELAWQQGKRLSIDDAITLVNEMA